MFVVMTRVQLKPGTHEQCATLFRETNPALVADEPDWLGARMMFDEATNIVTVLASWRDPASYKRLSASEAFQTAMTGFGPFFAAPPEITVHTVLSDMAP